MRSEIVVFDLFLNVRGVFQTLLFPGKFSFFLLSVMTSSNASPVVSPREKFTQPLLLSPMHGGHGHGVSCSEK